MKKANPPASVTTKKDADRFRKAGTAYTKGAIGSQKVARETLIELGIYTQKGNLTSKYKS